MDVQYISISLFYSLFGHVPNIVLNLLWMFKACIFLSFTLSFTYGCHLLFTCSTYSAIRSRYVDILRGSDNLRSILKTPPRRLSSYVYALLTHRDFVLQRMNTLLRKETYIKNTCILWSLRSKLASLWTINLILILIFSLLVGCFNYFYSLFHIHQIVVY